MTSIPLDGSPPALAAAGYWRFWSSRVLSTASFQIIGVVIGWQLYGLTGSAFDLGLVGLCQFLPMIVLTIPAGHVADRFDRRRVVRLCQWIEAATAASLAILSWKGMLSP